MFSYPPKLDTIFQKLLLHNIRPIIVGGYVRDFFLHRASKDIDIEVYGIDSYVKLEKLLQEFGNVNNVGKSFGICKLQLAEYEIDFSFPRTDSKVTHGHRGFSIQIDPSLNFTDASRRRDFTINAIGYDVAQQLFLDPFKGQEDLQKGVLQAVDSKTFGEDPLRILRAVQMSARFNLSISPSLHFLCEKMVKQGALKELPKERIFEEIKKLFFLAPKISSGFILLEKFGAFDFFTPFNTLNQAQKETIYSALDKLAEVKKETNKTNVSILFAVLCYFFSSSQIELFLSHFTNDTKLIKKVLRLVAHKEVFNKKEWSDYDLYNVARKIILEEYFLFLSAFTQDEKIRPLHKRAKLLQILTQKRPNLLQGKELIALGLQPSKLFSHILEASYEAQMKGKFTRKEEALKYVQHYLLP